MRFLHSLAPYDVFVIVGVALVAAGLYLLLGTASAIIFVGICALVVGVVGFYADLQGGANGG